MKSHLSNALYGLLDYGSYPVGMLIVAPIILRHRGPSEYGIWTITTALVSIGGILASGFGDANIQQLASRLGSSEGRLGIDSDLTRVVRTMMSIHLALGIVLAVVAWLTTPVLAFHISVAEPGSYVQCLWCFRLASILILTRAIETVCVSTQRAFQRYGTSIRISITMRLMCLAFAALLAIAGQDIILIVASTAALTVAGLWLQLRDLKRLFAGASLMPALDYTELSGLFSFGIFSWLIAVSGMTFNQIDRLMLGTSLGATALASYALCAQLTQPVYGLCSSGLHFIFPYLVHRRASDSLASLHKPVFLVFTSNLLLVAATTAFLMIFGNQLLKLWIGNEIAVQAASILPTLALGSGLLALNVTATYSLGALGHMKTVTCFNVVGGAAMFAMMFYLMPRYGPQGVAIAKLVYGIFALGMYLPLIRSLRLPHTDQTNLPDACAPTCEEA